MKNIYNFFEEMLFYPKWYHYFFIFLLFPLTLIYCLVVFFKFPRRYKNMNIPIISVGNIIVGGSGKTPITIKIANEFKELKPAVVLRGYKRKSKGLVVVSDGENILVDVDKSGDEAMEIATSCNAIVIVSENREEGILKAKSMGAGFVILDDGFDKPFDKFNIVIDVDIKNRFCLPSGGYRYPRSFLKYADLVLKEGIDFKRRVVVPNGDILISAISKPNRLLKFWNKEYRFFPDHYDFKEDDLKEFKDRVIITTKKDYVKLKKFNLNLKVIELDIDIKKEILDKISKAIIKDRDGDKRAIKRR